MKRELEKSLKRYLKRKLKVTLALLVSFLITGKIGYSMSIASESYINVQGNINNEIYEVTTGNDNYYYGIAAYLSLIHISEPTRL